MISDLAHFARVEQADSAAGKDAAVSLQISPPRAVGNVVRQDFCHIDCRRIERFDEQRDAPGKVVAVGFLDLGVRLGDAGFDLCACFGDCQHLAHQPVGCGVGRRHRALSGHGKFADLRLDLSGHRPLQCILDCFREALSAFGYYGGKGFACTLRCRLRRFTDPNHGRHKRGSATVSNLPGTRIGAFDGSDHVACRCHTLGEPRLKRAPESVERRVLLGERAFCFKQPVESSRRLLLDPGHVWRNLIDPGAGRTSMVVEACQGLGKRFVDFARGRVKCGHERFRAPDELFGCTAPGIEGRGQRLGVNGQPANRFGEARVARISLRIDRSKTTVDAIDPQPDPVDHSFTRRLMVGQHRP